MLIYSTVQYSTVQHREAHVLVSFNFFFFLDTEIRAAGGIISTEDITSYVPLQLEPLSVTFMGGSMYVGKYLT